MPRFCLLLLIMSLCCSQALQASESVRSVDIRLRGGLQAPVLSLDYDDVVEVDTEAAASLGLNIQALYGHLPGGGRHGYLVGGGIAVGSHEGERDVANQDDVGVDYVALEIVAGYLYRPRPSLSIEVKPALRFGNSKITLEAPDGTQTKGDSGSYASFGVEAGCWYTWSSGWQLGGDLGLQGWAGTNEFSGLDVTASGAGFTLMLGAGYRL